MNKFSHTNDDIKNLVAWMGGSAKKTNLPCCVDAWWSATNTPILHDRCRPCRVDALGLDGDAVVGRPRCMEGVCCCKNSEGGEALFRFANRFLKMLKTRFPPTSQGRTTLVSGRIAMPVESSAHPFTPPGCTGPHPLATMSWHHVGIC